ncbi:MAG TPA: pyridoxamine kinase [Clostridiales bacterium]|nr:pyridoxamine kinase [Clostridiales bacterium]
MTDHNRQKKIAVINDFCGFGRCSIAVSMPILSAMRVQCCPVPTSIFSNHTGFPDFFFDDYTEKMQSYIDKWKKLHLEFDGIQTGFLGSEHQIEIVKRFIEDFYTTRTTVIVDPVMGDHGKPYATYTPALCQAMKQLVAFADILTPNLTEACILTDTPYHSGHWTTRELIQLAHALGEQGPEKLVITGVPQKTYVSNLIYQRGGEAKLLRTLRIGSERSGTGDVFSSIVAADAVNHVPFEQSVRKASRFVKKCILRSIEMQIPKTDGVCFEEFLTTLR